MQSIDRYAVFGNPIQHSKSPEIHTAFAHQTEQALEYTKECIAEDKFVSAAQAFFAEGGRGLNITVPFKQDAFEFADTLTPRAKAAGAVNTLFKQNDGTILGDNTDGFGMVSDITERLLWQIKDKHVLVLGAGGAVRGVLLPLLECHPASITIANRTLAKAEELATMFADLNPTNTCPLKALSYSDITQRFDLVINGTSASLGGDLPPVPTECFGPRTHVYDMVYGKELTPFLQFAKQAGAIELADGLGMLVGQAAESFYVWRGIRPDISVVLEKMRK